MPVLAAPESADVSLDALWLPSRIARFSPQRDLMRQLFRVLGDDREAVCQAYVEAEWNGKVERPCGAEGMTPRIHAGTLWWEGRLRGWLRS